MQGAWLQACKGLREDEGGNFAMISALAAVPIMVAIGALATYADAVTVKSQTQAAADAAALAATTAFAAG